VRYRAGTSRAKHPEYDALLARLLDFQQHGRLFRE
jgi:hypothetical protein